METDFIYWRHLLPHGIMIEEITGKEDKGGAVWRTLAYQVYGENGRNGFRSISRTPCGAPILDTSPQRISVSHTDHLLVIASLPKTPETDLTTLNPRTALGIDAERVDRNKVIKLRPRFLSPSELELIPADSQESNIQAWTAKEALYKAALTPGLDWRESLRIISLPPVQKTFPLSASIPLGKALILLPDGTELPMSLFSYISEDYIITVVFSEKCAKFRKE